MLYVPGAARGVLFGECIQYSPANAVGCSQGYYPLEPEMLLFLLLLLSVLLFDSPKGFYSLLCTLFSVLCTLF